jgi:hypothetical protein
VQVGKMSHFTMAAGVARTHDYNGDCTYERIRIRTSKGKTREAPGWLRQR